jgi:hypothetical protein
VEMNRGHEWLLFTPRRTGIWAFTTI